MPSIAAIGAMTTASATRLRKSGIRTTEALLKRGATRADRRQLADATGLAEQNILEWVNRADLFRVKGIGAEYSDLLEAAGVDTVKELKTRKPASLHARLVEVNERQHLVRRLPTESMVAGWVAEAAKLGGVVTY